MSIPSGQYGQALLGTDHAEGHFLTPLSDIESQTDMSAHAAALILYDSSTTLFTIVTTFDPQSQANLKLKVMKKRIEDEEPICKKARRIAKDEIREELDNKKEELMSSIKPNDKYTPSAMPTPSKSPVHEIYNSEYEPRDWSMGNEIICQDLNETLFNTNHGITPSATSSKNSKPYFSKISQIRPFMFEGITSYIKECDNLVWTALTEVGKFSTT
ncbi:hypothetical protein SERLA73DRAFT_149028 [Serpula lacrymans var. lacrymans S7.3]|uniref:Uncharacterized protein n=2 Tax=Serpula lacrymans var. lacrymans TaxID=341189 RepID=F8PHU8_SERL3|nr:uncharacterized protein SERLADRAFT_404614 [Serpula lacrymans var. lacrymans S7.9]EGO04577.1 hypothetical protein SERLA73DRAFT_149028 [Serpula lacrymans var. lacrymans S7.3]EGO30452.1 hypothetical protein SERLADRAFT_404614 [Serpula lacrymans var. lacrymans S7.9]